MAAVLLVNKFPLVPKQNLPRSNLCPSFLEMAIPWDSTTGRYPLRWSDLRLGLSWPMRFWKLLSWVWLSKKSKVFCFAFMLYSQVHSRSWDAWTLWWYWSALSIVLLEHTTISKVAIHINHFLLTSFLWQETEGQRFRTRAPKVLE